jgi:homoserine kinase
MEIDMIKVMVPATSANIGPGFDCLGVALNMYNTFYFAEIESGLVIEGGDESYQNENNLIYVAMKKCFDKIGYTPKGIKISTHTDVPMSRGLGSSATCIVAGLVGANEIAGGKLSKDEILLLATEMEGHPDNVAPAIFGGMVAAIYEEDQVYYSNIEVAKGLKFCALIPNFKLSTEKARSVLPKEVPYKDAVYNVGRVSLMVTALSTGKFDLLKVACQDKLHQDYRGVLINNYFDIIKKCEEYGSLGAFLSGAGPTIMLMLEENNSEFISNIKNYLASLEDEWEVIELDMDFAGVNVK